MVQQNYQIQITQVQRVSQNQTNLRMVEKVIETYFRVIDISDLYMNQIQPLQLESFV